MNQQLVDPVDAVPVGIKAILDANPMAGAPKLGARRMWSTREIKVLKEAYPTGGINAALAALPGRSATSIYNKVHSVGMARFNEAGGRRQRRVWTTNVHIDEAIRRVYQGTPKLGEVKRLATMLGRPQHWISSRAKQLGLVLPRFKEPQWCEEELMLLRAHGGKHPDTVRRMLANLGFKRTSTAIILMAKRMHIAREIDENVYSAAALGELFGVDRNTVARWIARGLLKAKMEKARDPRAKEGGSWAIQRRDIRAFVIENVGIIDFRRLDKHWLVELLSSKVNGG